MTIDVLIEDDRWTHLMASALPSRAIETVLRHLDLDPTAWDVAVLACNDARIAELNKAFRNVAKPTNVLSWPSEERAAATPGQKPPSPSGDPELGDIAIAFETCTREAAAFDRDIADHTTHLLVHGALHLLGYDHVEDIDGDLMEATEIAILAQLGVANPYVGNTTIESIDDGKG